MDGLNYFYILITWLITSVDSQVISASLGLTSVLPCEFNATLKPSMFLQWRTDYAVVFERGRRDSYQGDRYKGRVDVPETQLLGGNCSLVLKNVWINDAGVYYAYLFEKRGTRSAARFIQRVKLQVYNGPGTNAFPPFLIYSFIVAVLFYLYYTVKRKLIKAML